MKLYKETINTMISTKTIKVHITDLDKIKLKTEDEQLIIGISNAITELTRLYVRSKLKSVPISLESTNSRHINALLKYCKRCMGTTKPEWQIIAERHGWKPK